MKKIGKLNGKVVVAGDKNLITENQIHYEEREGNITLSKRINGELNSVTGSVASSGGGSKVEYWGISDKVNINASFEEDPASAYLYMLINMLGGYFKGINASSEKVEVVSAYMALNHYENNKTLYFKSYKAFTFSPVFTEQEKYNTFNDALKLSNEQGVNLYDLVYPITEEEFYNLD